MNASSRITTALAIPEISAVGQGLTGKSARTCWHFSDMVRCLTKSPECAPKRTVHRLLIYGFMANGITEDKKSASANSRSPDFSHRRNLAGGGRFHGT